MYKKLFISIFILLLWNGCGSFKSNWVNFNAYYNTFYNANKNYHEGLDKILNVKQEYTSESPIRIHEKPVNSGTQEFEKSINKGADVLRKYPESKWIDESLLIIGKSYYFRKEYYSAIEKFEELYQTSEDNKFVQKAILWKSRVYLDMGFFDQGIQYLNEQIILFENEWHDKYLYEVKAVLAQLYVGKENWAMAAPLLEEVAPNIKNKAYRERSFFLLGQMYDLLEQPDKALGAFKKVENNYYNYDLQYLAKRKKAENARRLGDYDTALATFKEMLRDDKNAEFRPELNYEIARTLSNIGEYKEAEKIYKEILADKIQRPKAETLAKVYYGLAEVQRFGFDNFKLAAAYYDTASRQNASRDKLPLNFNAAELAESFGKYSDFKNEIHLQDSLLWVGQLPQDEFRNLISDLRQQKIKELEEELRKRQDSQNTMVNITGQGQTENVAGSGFLNVQNPSRLMDAKNQFKAIWGDRKLADNWRVMDLLRKTIDENQEDELGETNSEMNGNQQFTDIELEIDISRVPFTKAAQDSLEKEIAILNYELGNLFYLSLEMPDSAAYYFTKVLKDYPENSAKPMALYSLSELKYIEGDSLSAVEFAKELVERYPQSRYASRLAEKYSLEVQEAIEVIDATLMHRFEIINADSTFSDSTKAAMSAELATSNIMDDSAPVILYKSIQNFIRLAKQDSSFSTNLNNWMAMKAKWQVDKDSLDIFKAEIIELVEDTTLSEDEVAELYARADTTMPELDLTINFPYNGKYWDLARSNIDLFLNYFKNSALSKEINILKKELEVPEPPKSEEVEVTKEEEFSASYEFITCSDIGEEARPRVGWSELLGELSYDQASEPDELVYVFVINQRGIVESFELKTEYENYSDNLQLQLEDAFYNQLSFEPIIYEGEAIMVQCELKIPLK